MGLDLKTFLAQHKVSEHNLLSFIDETIDVAHPIVFLSGSLVKGFGTAHSDIDIYVISDAVEQKASIPRVLVFEGVRIDIEFWALEYVNELLMRLDRMPAHEEREKTSTLKFNPYEREFLHRLEMSRPVRNESILDGLRKRVKSLALARLMFDRALIRVNNGHHDLLGVLDQDDYKTAHYMNSQLAGLLADVVRHACGFSDPEEKWRFNHLKRIEKYRWDHDLPGPPLPGLISDIIYECMYPKVESNEDILRTSERIIALSNRLLPWGEQRFRESNKKALRSHDKLDQEETKKLWEPLKSSFFNNNLTFQVRYREDSWHINHISGKYVKKLNPMAFDIIQYLNAGVSMDETTDALAVKHDVKAKSLRGSVEDVVALFSMLE